MSKIYKMPGHLIRRMHQISTSVFTDKMKALGLDLTAPQFATLSVLASHAGVDQATLAGRIAHDRPTIGGVVERLAAKGYVTRQTSKKDKRAKVLAITDAGQALLDRLEPIVAGMQDEILPGLTDAERDMFLKLATKAADAGNDRSRAPLILPPRGDVE